MDFIKNITSLCLPGNYIKTIGHFVSKNVSN